LYSNVFSQKTCSDWMRRDMYINYDWIILCVPINQNVKVGWPCTKCASIRSLCFLLEYFSWVFFFCLFPPLSFQSVQCLQMTSDAHYPIEKTCLPMKVWSRCDVQVISVRKGGSYHGVGPTQEMHHGVLKLLFPRDFSHDAAWQPEAVRLWMVISAWERRGSL
jgi:hypothetical protein